MTTRCKVKCIATGKESAWGVNSPGNYGEVLHHTARFAAVMGPGNAENDAFFALTPSLDIKLGITKQQHFEVGKEYYLDFIEVEKCP